MCSVLQISLNGQQYTSYSIDFNVFDPCAQPTVASAWPVSGPAAGTVTRMTGTNFADVEGAVCSLVRLCQIPNSNDFFDCGALATIVQAVFVSDSAMDCPIEAARNASNLPQQLVVQVKNADSTAEHCTAPWGTGSAWSEGGSNFQYTEITATNCNITDVKPDGKAGATSWFMVQSFWGDLPAPSGGDSFDIVGSSSAIQTGVIDLDRQFTDFSRLPAGVNFGVVEQIAAELSLLPTEGSLCANTVDWGACCRALSTACTQIPNALGKYLIVWETLESGDHQINVTAGGIQVIGSPVAVVVVGADLSGANSRCTLDTVEANAVGDPLVGTLSLMDIFNNPRAGTPRMESGTMLPMRMELTSRADAKDIYWTLVPEGAVDMQAENVAQVNPYHYSDNEVAVTELHLRTGAYNFVALSAATDPPIGWKGASVKFVVWGDIIMDQQFLDFGSSITVPLHVGLSFELKIFICADATRDPIVCDPAAEYSLVPASEYDAWLGGEQEPGLYVFDVSIRRSGVFLPQATVNGETVVCAGAQLVVRPGPTSAQHSLFMPSSLNEAGSTATTHVIARDEHGNSREFGRDLITADFTLDGVACAGCVLSVNDLNNTGGYTIMYNTTVSGLYEMAISLNTLLVGGSTHRINVHSSSLSLPSTLYGSPGATRGVAGVPTTFTIVACDTFGNRMTGSVLASAYTLEINPVFDFRMTFCARQNASRELSPPANETIGCPTFVHFVRDSDNLFEASYTCTVAGLYNTEIQLYDPYSDFGSSSVINHTIAIVSGWPSARQSIVYGPGCNDSDAGARIFLYVQLVDVYGNENLEDSYGDQIGFIFNRSEALPLLWAAEVDTVPESYRVEHAGHGVFRVAYLFYPAMKYAMYVTVDGRHIFGERTTTMEACARTECTDSAWPSQVRLLAMCLDKTRLPPPRFVAAILDDSLIRISARFNEPTNMAGASDCPVLFAADVLALIGADSQCYWETASVLIIELGSTSRLNMTVISSLHHSAAGSSWSGSSWSSSSSADGFDVALDDVTADGLGPSDGPTFGRLEIRPGANLLAKFENSAACDTAVGISPPTTLISPVAVISGDRITSSCDSVGLDCALSYGGGPDALECSWRVTQSGQQLLQDGSTFSSYIGTRASPTVSIPASVLLFDVMYSIQLTVTNSVGMKDVTAWEFRRTETMVPKITLPQHLTVTRYDRNVVIRSALQQPSPSCRPSSLTVGYFWRQRERRDGHVVPIQNSGSKDLLIRKGQLTPNGSYIFELYAWFAAIPYGGQSRLPNAVVTVTTAPAAATTSRTFGKGSQLAIDSSQLISKVNADSRLALTAHHSTIASFHNASFFWWNTHGGLDLSDTLISPAGRQGANLVMSAGVLVPGQDYRFRLVLNGVERVEVTVAVNRPPARGTFEVEPSTGQAVTTPFLLHAGAEGHSAWTDEVEDLPLLYRFSYMRDSAEYPLGSASLHPKSTVYLPSGNAGSPLRVVARVADQFGAAATVSVDVQVDAAADNAITDFVHSLHATLRDTADHDKVLHGALNAAMALNDNAPPGRASGRRLQSYALARQQERWRGVLEDRDVRQRIRADLLDVVHTIIASNTLHEDMQPALIAALRTTYDLCETGPNATQQLVAILTHLPMSIDNQSLPLAVADASNLVSVLDKLMMPADKVQEACACPRSLCPVDEPPADPTSNGTGNSTGDPCPSYGCVEGRCYRTPVRPPAAACRHTAAIVLNCVVALVLARESKPTRPLPSRRAPTEIRVPCDLQMRNDSVCQRDVLMDEHTYDSDEHQWYQVACEVGYCRQNDANCIEGKCESASACNRLVFCDCFGHSLALALVLTALMAIWSFCGPTGSSQLVCVISDRLVSWQVSGTANPCR